MKYLSIGLVFAFALLSCRKTNVVNAENKVTKNGVLSVWATSVKEKRKKVDIGWHMKNESSKDVIVLLGEILCYRGSTQGTVTHTFYNVGERTIDFKPGQHKDFTLVCRLDEKATGNVRVEIKRVYENPGGDGKTRGTVLAKDIQWTFPTSKTEN